MKPEMERILARLRTGGWPAVVIYLAVALATLAVLSYLLKKTNPAHLTIGAGLVMLLYATASGFLLLASRLFVSRRDESG
jgi:hypothetical protein